LPLEKIIKEKAKENLKTKQPLPLMAKAKQTDNEPDSLVY
jgi:hypothetical protein